MTTRPPAAARGDRFPAEVPEGALLRVAVDDEAWAEGIPPVPAGREVSVSFSTAAAARLHAAPAEMLGYRIVGTVAAAPGGGAVPDGPVAHVLVPQAVLEAHPRWWRALAGRAERAYSLASGPAVRALGDVLRAHLGSAERG